MSFIKFGIGRATSDTAHEIRDGRISREEGIMLIKKFDGELSKRYFDITLEYMSISEKEFWEVIDTWRSPHIWEKTGTQEEWKLKNPIWKD